MAREKKVETRRPERSTNPRDAASALEAKGYFGASRTTSYTDRIKYPRQSADIAVFF